MHALVTGGLGFIGSAVVDLLITEGFEVTVIDNLSTGSQAYANPKASYIRQDLQKISPAAFHAFDYVFHLAALPRIQPSFDAPLEHEDANVLATIHLLEGLKSSRKLKKLVYSASSACYGTPDRTPTDEAESIKPLSPYALQKYAAEQYCLILGQRWELPVVTLRYFNAYGPRSFNENNRFNAYTSVIGIFHHQRSRGLPLTITGDGSQQRDFVHVHDIAHANLLAATSQVTGEAFNVGFGVCFSILEIARMFDAPYIFIPEREGEALITLADISKIRRMLGWTPAIDIKAGIQSYELNNH
jgi:UDP-glucose 4-epimerase